MGFPFSGVLTGTCNRTQKPRRQTTSGIRGTHLENALEATWKQCHDPVFSLTQEMWVPVYPDTFPEDAHGAHCSCPSIHPKSLPPNLCVQVQCAPKRIPMSLLKDELKTRTRSKKGGLQRSKELGTYLLLLLLCFVR